MRTTVTLDDDVFEAAQGLASSTGKRLGQVLSELLRRGLRSQGDFAVQKGMPVFRISSNAPVIPSDRARQLLAEDDR